MRVQLQHKTGSGFRDVRVLEVEGSLEWLPFPPETHHNLLIWEGSEVSKLRRKCETLLQSRISELRRRIIRSEKRDCFYVPEMEILLREAAFADRSCHEIVMLLRAFISTEVDRVLMSSEGDLCLAFECTATG